MAAALSRQGRNELIHEAHQTRRSGDLHVCAECKHALLFAVQPRAVCTCRDSASAGKVLFAGQPACEHVSLRDPDDMALALCGPGLTAPHALFIGTPARHL
jgi:hypothetical protein